MIQFRNHIYYFNNMATLPLFVRPSETVMSWVRRTVHPIACCRVREAECGRRRGLLQSAGGGAASSLPPTPPLPTLLLSQIRQIQAMRVGNCCGGGGSSSILRVRLCNCCNGRGGDADAAATAEAAGPGRTRRQRPPHRLHLPDCDDAAAPVQAARSGRIAMISQESPLVIENLSLNCHAFLSSSVPPLRRGTVGPA